MNPVLLAVYRRESFQRKAYEMKPAVIIHITPLGVRAEATTDLTQHPDYRSFCEGTEERWGGKTYIEETETFEQAAERVASYIRQDQQAS